MARGTAVPPKSKPFGRRGLFGLALLLLLLLPACGRKPPEVSFRYRFQPGEELTYRVSLRGEGEVTMTMVLGEEEENRTVFPVRLEGEYLMDLRVREVSPEGEAALSLSYRGFELATTSTISDREFTVRLTDDRAVIAEGQRVISETAAGEEEFPLRGVVGEEFEIRVDDRGTILQARVPEAPEELFPSLRFESFLERMQPEFPAAPVPLGSTWSRTIEMPGPGMQRHWDGGERWTIRLDSTFRALSGGKDETAVIDHSGDYEQSAPEGESGEGPGLRGSSHHLSGTTDFNIPGGRVVSGRSTLRQTLDIRMPFGQVLRERRMEFRVEDTVEVSVQLER